MTKFYFLWATLSMVLSIFLLAECSNHKCQDEREGVGIIMRNNSFCVMQINDMTNTIASCASFYQPIFDTQVNVSSHMLQLSLELISIKSFTYSALDSIDHINSVVDEAIKTYRFRNNRDSTSLGELILTDPDYFSKRLNPSIKTMEILNKIRAFVFFLHQDVCVREESMHLNQPSAIGVYKRLLDDPGSSEQE